MRVLRAVEWCRRQAAAAILPLLLAGFLTGERSEALTTAGKSNTLPPPPPTPSAPPARECTSRAHCAGITGTSCVSTNLDSTMRCLCGDNEPPVNGRCPAQYRGLRHMCSESTDCQEGLVCQTPNSTETGKPAWAQSDKQTLCLCDTENGYVEKDHYCSDVQVLKASFVAIVVVFFIRMILD